MIHFHTLRNGGKVRYVWFLSHFQIVSLVSDAIAGQSRRVVPLVGGGGMG